MLFRGRGWICYSIRTAPPFVGAGVLLMLLFLKGRCSVQTSGTFESDLKKAILEKDVGFEEMVNEACSASAIVYKEAVIALKYAVVDVLVAELDIEKCKAQNIGLATLAIMGHLKLSAIMMTALGK